jgi:hypothetical protein
MPAHPTYQIRGYPLEPDDPITTEWTVIVINSSGVEGLFGRQHPDSTDYDGLCCIERRQGSSAARFP